jgi:hypothetical protein
MIRATFVGNSITNIVEATGQYASVSVYFCNIHHTADEYVTLYLTPAGVNPSDSNTIVKNLRLGALDTLTFGHERFILDGGEKVVASGVNGNRVSAVASYTTL